ncbi:DUF456 domain-containing protein [Kiritimatiellota bacterium B12222]|nr:DUF456 domain-containing protein [Kiritimatiellota bacterium B12222]
MQNLFTPLAVLPLVSAWSITLWVILVVVILCGGFILNLFGMAGNWVIFGVSVAHFFMVNQDMQVAIPFSVLVALLLLALSGEGLEFLSGILGAGKAGGSRRAMMLSMIGGMAGSLFGFGLGNAVVPILGGIVGIFLVGGLGSLAGAMLGEMWKGSAREKQLRVGKSAFWGRILGTLAKTLIGSCMMVLAFAAIIF